MPQQNCWNIKNGCSDVYSRQEITHLVLWSLNAESIFLKKFHLSSFLRKKQEKVLYMSGSKMTKYSWQAPNLCLIVLWIKQTYNLWKKMCNGKADGWKRKQMSKENRQTVKPARKPATPYQSHMVQKTLKHVFIGLHK